MLHPAQLTIPMLVRGMPVLEDSDDERLYLGKGTSARVGDFGRGHRHSWRADPLGKGVNFKPRDDPWAKIRLFSRSSGHYL
jgi:hypothetical protein